MFSFMIVLLIAESPQESAKLETTEVELLALEPGSSRHPELDPLGTHLLFRQPDGAFVQIRAADGIRRELPFGSDARAATHAADGKSIWWVDSASQLHRYDLSADQNQALLSLHTDADVRGLHASSDGAHVSWWDSDSRGGIVATDTAASCFELDHLDRVSFGSGHGPKIGFDRNGQHALFYRSPRRAARRGDTEDGGLQLLDLETGEIRARWPVYVTDRSPGFANAWDGIVYGRREPEYQVVACELETLQERILDPRARRGHFLDLFASRDGRWVAEWDFEKRSVRVFDLSGEVANRGASPPARWTGRHRVPRVPRGSADRAAHIRARRTRHSTLGPGPGHPAGSGIPRGVSVHHGPGSAAGTAVGRAGTGDRWRRSPVLSSGSVEGARKPRPVSTTLSTRLSVRRTIRSVRAMS